MSFQLKDIPAHHFRQVNDFFEQGPAGQQLTEHSQTISHQLVEGHATDWYFDGIRMGYSDWYYREAVDLPWRYDIQIELVTLQVNLRGSVFIGRDTSQAPRLFTNRQHNLFYANKQDSNEGFLRNDRLRSSMFFLQFTKEAFLRITTHANESLQRFCEAVVKGQSTLLASHNLPVEAPMQHIIHNIVHCPYRDGLKQLYLLSKSIELLVLQAEACQTSITPAYQYLKTPADINAIHYARDYVLDRLEAPPSLSTLARLIGINEYKLKRGFKEIYGNTVFGFIADARLEMARNELLESNKSAAEIAATLGYSSPQHFSAAFKKKFGIAPNTLRKPQ